MTKLTAPPCRRLFVAAHAPHAYPGRVHVLGPANSLQTQVVVLCACVSKFSFHVSPYLCIGEEVCRTTAPLSGTTCLTTAACLDTYLQPMPTNICPPVLKSVYPIYPVLAPVSVSLFRCTANSGKPWG